MRCFGHRGAKGYALENTMSSFHKALSLGIEWIELDIHEIEGDLVVVHDRPKKVSNRTLSGGERMPLLGEVLREFKDRLKINIEIKGESGAKELAKLLRQSGWDMKDLLISSFNHAELESFHAVYPNAPTGILYERLGDDFKGVATRCNARSIHVQLRHVDQAIVERVHREGLRIYVYTVNEPSDIERMKSFGVDGVFSDFPDRVLG